MRDGMKFLTQRTANGAPKTFRLHRGNNGQDPGTTNSTPEASAQLVGRDYERDSAYN
jgi:hypothetical protein